MCSGVLSVCYLPVRRSGKLISSSGLLKILALTWHGLVFLFPVLDAHLEPWFLLPETSVFPHWSTRGVIPVPCHSHNDYWRRIPLQSALAAGCISVEADVWLSDDELLVGHTQHTLKSEQTLRKLYLEPLTRMLYKHNAMAENVTLSTSKDDIAGVFATDPAQTLFLLVDFKDNGEKIWPHLVKQLEPLRQDGFLSHVNGSDLIRRPVTIVVTGNAPFSHILENTLRDVFYDAPLDKLSTALDSPPIQSNATSLSKAAMGGPYTPLNSYYASADFRKTIGSVALNRFSQGQLVRLRRQVKAAHDLGLKVRYWGTPNWPRGLRNHVWQVLVREGVDVVSTDDLKDVTSQDWGEHRGWWG
ncbi:hypothetical protein N7474_005219 [Penicillium riverlandense]|uniref:uncharacterized protein n=1 Tax=Penicillium riverlandense TaxID=1903569 RepID=UPI002547FFE7|nr:uncharacterized protein N7474_005219 [Penicillium riverlandense]KAJ5819628.1 hypothetical protein N7474_005219 [Penicillium riverlandense]